ncbi:hypothetical protein QEH53_23840, partial [Pelagicoccus sp. SDUM812002]|nr:hypothetical protein [Pelagicoccus sp. SDUM812002]
GAAPLEAAQNPETALRARESVAGGSYDWLDAPLLPFRLPKEIWLKLLLVCENYSLLIFCEFSFR